MNPGRFFMPRMTSNIGPMMRASYLPMRSGTGFFGRIANSLRSFNWSGLLNGANKTLNVVNQTIPLVRQAGPMFNNMKSMMRIARAFGSETNKRNFSINNNNRTLNNNDNNRNSLSSDNSSINENLVSKKEVTNDSYPNFFV